MKKTTQIVGKLLEKENGGHILVVSVPWTVLATSESLADAVLAFSVIDTGLVLAAEEAPGRWRYVGEASLTAICEARIGQSPQWDMIPWTTDPDLPVS